MNATKNGIKSCPNCKAVDEEVLEGSFLEMFHLLAENYDDVLDSVLNTIESVLNNDTELHRLQQIKKDINTVESRKKRLTDLLIDGMIEKEAYDAKMLDFTRKLHYLSEQKAYLEENVNQRKNIEKRMAQLRSTLETQDAMDAFDRVVFESIVEKVIVGGYDAEGNPAPYKLTFVLKTDQNLAMEYDRAGYKAMQKSYQGGKKVV